MKNHEDVVRSVLSQRDAALKKRRASLRTAMLIGLTLCLLTATIAAVLLIGASRKPSDHPEDPSGEASNPTEDDSSSGTAVSWPDGVPEEPIYNADTFDWYEPGTLKLNTLVRSADSVEPMRYRLSEALSTEIGGLTEGKFTQLVEARFVDVTGLLQTSTHRDHGCVLFDTKKKELVCLTCSIRDALKEQGILTDDLIFVDNLNLYSKVSFALFSEASNRISARYVLDMEAGTLKEMPVLSANDIGGLVCSPDMKLLLTFATRKEDSDYDDVYLIDTESGEAKQIAKGQPTFLTGMFSPDGRNILLLLKNEYGVTNGFGSEACSFLLWNTENGNSVVCSGTPLQFSDGRLITRDRTGYRVYDRSGCTEVDPVPGTYVVEKRPAENGDIGYFAYRIDLVTGEEKFLGSGDMILVSDDGKYLYAYATGEEAVLCRHIANEEELFHVKVPESFRKTILQLYRQGDVKIMYQAQLSEKLDEMILCYYTIPISSSEEPQKEENERYSRMSEKLWKYYLGSSDIRGIYERLSTDEDFAYYRFSFGVRPNTDAVLAVEFMEKMRVVFVEDYRSGTFTAYLESKDSYNIAPYEKEGGARRIVPLTSTEAQTNAFLFGTDWQRYTLLPDYAEFYKNGAFRDELAEDFKFSDAYLSTVTQFTGFFMGNPGYESGETGYLRAFLKEFLACGRKQIKIAEKREWFGSLMYNGMRIYAERKDGRYYLMANEYTYEVPEYVFADFLGLIAYANLEPMTPITNPQTEIAKKYAGDPERKEMLTITKLKTILSAGNPEEPLRNYQNVVISETNSNMIRVLFYLNGEEGHPDAFAFAGFDTKNGTLKRFLLFDRNYRYLADLLQNERQTVKGKLTFGEWLPKNPQKPVGPDSYEKKRNEIMNKLAAIETEMEYRSIGVLALEFRKDVSFTVVKKADSGEIATLTEDLLEGAFATGISFTIPAEEIDHSAWIYIPDAELLLEVRPYYTRPASGEMIEVFDLEIVSATELPIEKLEDYLAVYAK